MAERALADADQADARGRGGDVRPLLGVPIAVKDTEDVAGEVTRWGTAAFSEPARPRRRAGLAPARGGRRDHRQDQPPGAGHHRRHRGPGVRRHEEPLEHGRLRGRVERRQRRGRRGRARGRAPPPRTGRGRSASPPPTAGSWASSRSATGSRSRRSASTGTGSAWSASRRAAWPMPRSCSTWERARPASGATPERPTRAPGRLRVALSTKPPVVARVDPQLRRAVEETGERLRALGHAVQVRDPEYPLAAAQQLHRPLPRRDRARTWPRVPRPRPAPAPHTRLRADRPAGAGERRRARQARRRRPGRADQRDLRRRATCS